MVVGDRERALGALLAELGYRRAVHPVPRVPGLPSPAREWILELYRELGGIQPHPVLTPRGWDHPLSGLVVELDEGQHFTPYRQVTLSQEWGAALPWRADYLKHITRFAPETSRRFGSGGFWTKQAAERLFGPSAPARQLSGRGSARWKQRALYDAIRDASAVAGQVNLARLSVYDLVGGRPLGDVLLAPATVDLDALGALIDARTLGPTTRPQAPSAGAVRVAPAIPAVRAVHVEDSRTIQQSSRPLDAQVPSLRELARELRVEEKTLRGALRKQFRPHQSQRGGAWDPLSPEMVSFARSRYACRAL